MHDSSLSLLLLLIITSGLEVIVIFGQTNTSNLIPQRQTFGSCKTRYFYRPEVFPVVQKTVLKHWKKSWRYTIKTTAVCKNNLNKNTTANNTT